MHLCPAVKDLWHGQGAALEQDGGLGAEQGTLTLVLVVDDFGDAGLQVPKCVHRLVVLRAAHLAELLTTKHKQGLFFF